MYSTNPKSPQTFIIDTKYFIELDKSSIHSDSDSDVEDAISSELPRQGTS